MVYIKDLIKKTIEEGYEDENADSKVCQGIVLHANELISVNESHN